MGFSEQGILLCFSPTSTANEKFGVKSFHLLILTSEDFFAYTVFKCKFAQ